MHFSTFTSDSWPMRGRLDHQLRSRFYWREPSILLIARVYGGSDVSTLQTIERTRRGGDDRRPPHINHTFPANSWTFFPSRLFMAHPVMDGSTEIRNGTNMRGWPQGESSCLGLDPILRPCERGLVREYSAALWKERHGRRLPSSYSHRWHMGAARKLKRCGWKKSNIGERSEWQGHIR